MTHWNAATRSLRRLRRDTRAPSRSAPATAPAALQIFIFRFGTYLGTELFDASSPVLIGRHPSAHLHLDADTVSRSHCRLTFHDTAIYLEDLGSTNGTLLNRFRILHQKIAVEPMDAICIGPFVLKARTLLSEATRAVDDARLHEPTRVQGVLDTEGTFGERSSPIEVEEDIHRQLYEDALRRRSNPPREQQPTFAGDTDIDEVSGIDEPHARGSASSFLIDPADRQAEIAQGLLSRLPSDESRALQPSGGPMPAESGPAEAGPAEAGPAEAGPGQPTRDPEPGHPRRGVPAGASVEQRPALRSEIPRQNILPHEDSSQGAVDETHDPSIGARLKDLDELIAALDRRQSTQRNGSVLRPWRENSQAQKDRSTKQQPGQRAMSTTEFARDLASKLAVQGEIVESKTGAKVIELESRRRSTSHGAAMPVEDEDTERCDEEIALLLSKRPISKARLESARHEAQLLTPSEFRVGVSPVHTADQSPADPRRSEKSAQDELAKHRVPIDAQRRRIFEADGEKRGVPSPNPAADLSLKPPNKRGDSAIDQLNTAPLSEDPRGHRALAPSMPSKAASPPPVQQPAAALPQKPADGAQSVRRVAGTDGVEIAARSGTRLLSVAVLRNPGEQYVLGHPTPQGTIAPAGAHLGLRLVRINHDSSVDLVFPRDVAGQLVRGATTVMFSELTEGRKYSCLRLETQDAATVVLGSGKDLVSYQIRFLHRPDRKLQDMSTAAFRPPGIK